MLQERHHRSLKPSVANSPTVVAPPEMQTGIAPITRGELADVLTITAAILYQRFGVSTAIEWFVYGAYGLRLPVNYRGRAGARFGAWAFRSLTVLGYDIRVATASTTAGAWDVHCFTRGASPPTRHTVYPLYGSAHSGSTKVNRPPRWAQERRDECFTNQELVSVDARVQHLRSISCAFEDIPLPFLECTVALAGGSKDNTYSEQHDSIKTRVSAPQPKNLADASKWIAQAVEAACDFIELFDQGMPVYSAFEASYSPFRTVLNGYTSSCSFISAVELALYVFAVRESWPGSRAVQCSRSQFVDNLLSVLRPAQSFLISCAQQSFPRTRPLERVLALEDIIELCGHLALIAQAVGQCDGKIVAQAQAWRKLSAVQQRHHASREAAAAAAAAATAAAAAAAAAAPVDAGGAPAGGEDDLDAPNLLEADVAHLAASARSASSLAGLLSVEWLRAEVRRRGLTWRESRSNGRKGRKLNKKVQHCYLYRVKIVHV